MKKPKIISLVLLMLSLSFNTLFSQTTEKDESNQVEILDYPKSFSELLKKFEGKVVYIDVLASWCKPCIGELKESKKLEPFFNQSNIVKLYITIDNEEDINRAFEMIENESLNGYFTSYHPVNSTFVSSFPAEFSSLFLADENGNLDISIPRYAIVDKQGKIVVKRAERPSNSNALKKQLEKYL